MAYQEAVQSISLPVASDYSAKQYRFGQVNSSGRFELTSSGAPADGVLQDKPSAAGNIGSVAISGVSKVSAGGTIAAGDYVMSDADGDAIVATSGSAVAGIALAAAVSGDIFPVLLKLNAADL